MKKRKWTKCFRILSHSLIFRDTTLIPAVLLLAGSLQRTNIRVSYNVEKSSVLSSTSALLFRDDFRPPSATGSHRPPALCMHQNEVLFPVIRFHYVAFLYTSVSPVWKA